MFISVCNRVCAAAAVATSSAACIAAKSCRAKAASCNASMPSVGGLAGVDVAGTSNVVGVSATSCGNRERRSVGRREKMTAAGAVGDGGGVAAAGCWRGEIMSKRNSIGIERELGDDVDEDRA